MQRLLEPKKFNKRASMTINKQLVHRKRPMINTLLRRMHTRLKQLPHKPNRFIKLQLTTTNLKQITERHKTLLITRIIRNHTQPARIVIPDILNRKNVSMIQMSSLNKTVVSSTTSNRISNMAKPIKQMVRAIAFMQHNQSITPMNPRKRTHRYIRSKADCLSSLLRGLIIKRFIEQSHRPS